MKKYISIALILYAAISATAQKTNDAIQQQLKSLKSDKQITLTYDPASDSTKVMVRADNFSDAEAKAAGIQAMNFGMAFYYAGRALTAPPETIDLSFWIMSKKPKFAAAHNWVATVGSETLDMGDARYGAKSSENMEYLNFKISRDDLAKIAAGTDVKFKLGTADFTFTPAHLTIFKSLIAITDTR